jgi:glutamyl/glutaminyl-tRNA synthetase
VNRTRFAPAPTGYLHLGHVANALNVWGLASAEGARVLFRIEDHDRVRSRPEFDAALVEDLAWLGFVADDGPVRQSEETRPYADAVERLRADSLVYGCDCSRATFDAWQRDHGAAWSGVGCPGGCRDRGLDGPTLRIALGAGSERWMDLLVGPCADEVSPNGDPSVRDRDGNWTYLLCVVVDDLRQGVDLVVRGRDLMDTTPAQIRLARLLGRQQPPTFAHHRLVRDQAGRKLSKSSGDTGVRELRAAGHSADEVVAMAAAAIAYDGDPKIGRRPIERPAIDETHTR